jgi:hypothetical protein
MTGTSIQDGRIAREEAAWLRLLLYDDLVNDLPEDPGEKAV